MGGSISGTAGKAGPWLVALGAALWATDALFRSQVVGKYGDLFIVCMNHAIVLPVALPLLWLGRRQLAKLRRGDWLALGFIAAAGSVGGMWLFTTSFRTASNYTIPVLMQKLQPLIAISAARLVLREQLSKEFWLWLLMALVGAYGVSFGYTNATAALQSADLGPMALAVGAATVWGLSTVAGRRLTATLTFPTLTAARFTLGALVSAAAVWTQGAQAQGELGADLSAFVLMATVSGAGALAIYYAGLRTTRASIATLCELAFPLAAIVVNWVAFDAALTPPQLVGAGLLLFAVTGLCLREPQWQKLDAGPRP